MRDVAYDRESESPYECFDCGTILTEESNPVTCPDCGGAMRNRMIPFE